VKGSQKEKEKEKPKLNDATGPSKTASTGPISMSIEFPPVSRVERAMHVLSMMKGPQEEKGGPHSGDP
jgi:hypothetical protein